MRYPFLNLATVNARYAEELRIAAQRVIDSGQYIGGDEIMQFNVKLASMCNAPHAIGVSNGLDALRLILEGYKAMGRLRVGDEIIVPANTYIASILAITHAGLIPVLTDPDPNSMNLDAKGIRDSLTERTRAIMPVHLYGRVAWDTEMACVVKESDLLVIEDAAQAIGARASVDGLYGSRMAGAIGHAGAISFYPTKNLGALGDAGAVITHDSHLAETIKALANYGSDVRYHNIYAGFNCRIDPIQAAMLSAKLPDTHAANARRFERAVAYNNVLDHPLVTKPMMSAAATDCVWHQYVIRIGNGMRDSMQQYLTDNGVGTDIHYPVPPHRQPCYAELNHKPLPVTESLVSEILSLPISDGTSVKDAAEIAEIINRFNPHKSSIA